MEGFVGEGGRGRAVVLRADLGREEAVRLMGVEVEAFGKGDEGTASRHCGLGCGVYYWVIERFVATSSRTQLTVTAMRCAINCSTHKFRADFGDASGS